VNTSFRERFSAWVRALWPAGFTWRRYRVTPHTNPARFRRELLRSIRDELRVASFHPPGAARETRL
jgi:hypothetical protein